MSHLMKLAETLRDIAEECRESEIEQALGLCMGFADRVRGESLGAAECGIESKVVFERSDQAVAPLFLVCASDPSLKFHRW
jgi:hypothetical protein